MHVEIEKDDTWLIAMSCSYLNMRISWFEKRLSNPGGMGSPQIGIIEDNYSKLKSEVWMFMEALDDELHGPSGMRHLIIDIKESWERVESAYGEYLVAYWSTHE